MPRPILRLFDDVPDAGFRFDLAPAGGTPRPVADCAADIAAIVEGGSPWVVLDLVDAAHHPDLEDILWEVDEVGGRAKLLTLGGGLDVRDTLERLRNAGLAQMTVVLYGADAATHDARVGREGAFDTAMEVVERGSRLNSLLVIVRYVLLRDNHEQVGAAVTRVRHPAERFELVRLSALTRDRDVLKAHGVPRRQALEAAQAAWEAARVGHLKLETQAFATWPAIPMPSTSPVQPADATLLGFHRENVPVPAATNGTWATPADGDVAGLWTAVERSRSLTEFGLQLAAYGTPALDLPPALGGLGLDQPPGTEDAAPDETPDVGAAPAPRGEDGIPEALADVFDAIDAEPLPHWGGSGRAARVHVVAGLLTDNVLALSTLPALADRLAALGADVTLHSLWREPVNPYDHGHTLPDDTMAEGADPDRPGWRYPPEHTEAFAAVPARYAHARKQADPWLRSLDLSDADLVVVPGFDNARMVMEHGGLSDATRVVVPDFHLMTGIEAWHGRWLASGRPMDGGWWPSERVEVHALYPRYVRAYWRAGVPLRQVAWRPYPLHLGHFGRGPDPVGCTTMFAGGNHQRDWRTLARAMKHLGDDAPELVLHTREATGDALPNRGEVRLLHFHEALANSRFVVLPLLPDPRRPAGISVVSMALAAGRPVIASSTLATVDHLRHGHNAILVPPNRPRALAKAIRRLAQDDALVATLAAGARRAAEELSVDRWARGLLDGFAPATVFSTEDAPRGPFHAWPG